MAEQIKPGMYKAEWTEKERDELYSLSDEDIEDLKETVRQSGMEGADALVEEIDAASDAEDSD